MTRCPPSNPTYLLLEGKTSSWLQQNDIPTSQYQTALNNRNDKMPTLSSLLPIYRRKAFFEDVNRHEIKASRKEIGSKIWGRIVF